MKPLYGALGALLAVSACASPAAPGGPVQASPPPVNPTYETQVATDRGSLPTTFGQHAAVTSPGMQDVVLDFVLTGPGKPKCNVGALDPKNGKYITVKISAKSAADPQNVLQGLIFGAGWEYVGKTGESLEATTPEAASCSFDAPLGMKPNRSYNFDLVLDVPQNTGGGVIVFDPNRNGGWEWPLS